MTTILPDFVVVNPMFSIISLLYDTWEYSFGIRFPFKSIKFVSIFTNLTDLDSKSNWNLVVSNKSATEITSFEMPTDRNEILVGVVFGDGGRNFVLSKVFHRGYDFTDSNPALHMLGGFQGTNYNSGCYVSVKSGAVYIDSVFYNNNDIKKNSKYFVAYR